MDAQEKQIYFALLIATLVLGWVISYFIFSSIKQQKKVLRLQLENASAQITVLEKDRARIAADLHDDLSPLLSAVRMKINSFELTDPFDEEQLVMTNSTIDDMAVRLRAISFDLMPASLQHKGLVAALREFTSYTNSDYGVKIKLLLPKDPLNLSDSQAINIYRIVQEIVHNTLKHANATELLIGLEPVGDNLILETQDNGKGFSIETIKENRDGLGLKSLENRTMLLGATHQLRSTIGKGTHHVFQIPLTHE